MPDEIGIDVERLLRERGWLRALARGLVGPGDVDDVVQESWLAALGAGSRPRTSLRAWWAGLARNAARATRGARRREREPRAPLEAGESEAGELLARAELQERAAPISVGITEVATMGVLAKVSVGGSAVAALALAASWRASGDEVRTAERAHAPEAARVASSRESASPAAEASSTRTPAARRAACRSART